MDGHGAYQGCPLPHASGQFGRLLVLKSVKIIVLEQLQHVVAVFLIQCVVEFQSQNDVLIDGPPFKKMIPLQHITDSNDITPVAVGNVLALVEQVTFLRCEQSCYNGQKRRFADGSILETFDSWLVITLKVFRGMNSVTDFDMDKICDRLRYALRKNGISYLKAAKDIGVSRDLVFDYTNPNYPEESMQVKTLIKFASYLGEEKYYFCNEYQRFLDTVNAGAFLRKLRKTHKMTQRQFAGYLEIPYCRYKTYESGKCKLPQEVFEGLKREEELG